MTRVRDFINGFHSMNTNVEYLGIFDAQRKELYTGEPVNVPTNLQDLEVLHAQFTPNVNASVIVPAVIREVQELDIY